MLSIPQFNIFIAKYLSMKNISVFFRRSGLQVMLFFLDISIRAENLPCAGLPFDR